MSGKLLGPPHLVLQPPLGWHTLPSLLAALSAEELVLCGLGTVTKMEKLTGLASFPALNSVITGKDFTVFTKRLLFSRSHIK